MSTLTRSEILDFFYNLLKNSTLKSAVNGGLYRLGSRPRDSKKEDIVVGFVSGLANQFQTGVIAICVYVTDIDPYDNGVLIEDMSRTLVLERVAQNWVDSHPEIGSDYFLRLQDTITTVEDEPIHQHFVSIMLHYTLFNE